MNDDTTGIPLEYFALDGAERAKHVYEKIKERELAHWELREAEASLDGNPELGEHIPEEERIKGPDKKPVPCGCGGCELKRVRRAKRQLEYAIRALKALHAGLTQ